MTVKIPERLAWAVDVLDVQPDNQILEIGCGHGLAVSLICERLQNGQLTALDRSQKMIEVTKQRNASCLSSGKLRLICSAIDRADLDQASFDRIFAVNVNVFWMQPTRELPAIRAALKPDGMFFLFYQPPDSGKIEQMVAAVQINLERHGLIVRDIFTSALASGQTFGIAATLNH